MPPIRGQEPRTEQIFIGQAAEIVSAFMAHNSVPPAGLPNLLRTLHDALASLGELEPVEAAPEPLRPAVPIQKTGPDKHIISLEDGRKLE